jgi:hypothetical protein
MRGLLVWCVGGEWQGNTTSGGLWLDRWDRTVGVGTFSSGEKGNVVNRQCQWEGIQEHEKKG